MNILPPKHNGFHRRVRLLYVFSLVFFFEWSFVELLINWSEAFLSIDDIEFT